MLVFTRKSGESLVIGDNIRVTVLSADRDQVRIGIQAPREISIHRSEVYEAIVAQNQAASQSALPPADLLTRLKQKK
jgi:carbon storage regulator